MTVRSSGLHGPHVRCPHCDDRVRHEAKNGRWCECARSHYCAVHPERRVPVEEVS